MAVTHDFSTPESSDLEQEPVTTGPADGDVSDDHLSDDHLSDDIASDPVRFTNRELSWLAFNSRVLAQAEDASLPLLERLKFCAIYASNLDEFYMVRVAGLKDQVAAGITRAPADGMSPTEQLTEIRSIVARQAHRLERAHIDRLRPALADAGVRLAGWDDLDVEDRAAAGREFTSRVFPVLTPLAVDPGHPFPYISSLSLNLALIVMDPTTGSRHFARLKVPPALDRFFRLPSGAWLPIEQLIAAHARQMFPGMDLVGAWPFRVTRNADLTLNDEDADDLLELVEIELRRRRFGRAIRLEIDHTMPTETLELLVRELDLDDDDVFEYRGLIDCSDFFQIASLPERDLSLETFSGVVPVQLRNIESSEQLFARLRRADVLIHHPYDSFNASVTEFVRRAANDPKVRAIKLTLYRTSGDSPIVEALIRAAEQGKQVAVLVELKARFDEQANIEWARQLEEAGVHVVYGLVGLKIHTKVTLVVREEGDSLRLYSHVGTGNYNPKTARIYEDVGLLTASTDVGTDVTQLFNYLTGYSREVNYERLMVAPDSLRSSLRALIDREIAAGPGRGRIILKMNSLVDASVIDHLYRASRAGVEIDLILRGICCLRPGIPGLSENIRVRSIVGRYLEHSRIWFFANGSQPGTPLYAVGSADLMPRNLDRRVEALVTVANGDAQGRLREILESCLADDELAWELNGDGTYERLTGGTVNVHDLLEELATDRATISRTVPEDSWAGSTWRQHVHPTEMRPTAMHPPTGHNN